MARTEKTFLQAWRDFEEACRALFLEAAYALKIDKACDFLAKYIRVVEEKLEDYGCH